jgi:hypothetical protein
MKGQFATALLLAAMTFPMIAQAQLPSLGGAGPSPDAVVKNYVEGAKNVLRAQGKLLTAINKKEEGARATLLADNLTEGATKQNLEDATKTQTDNSKLLEDSFKAKGTAVDAASKVVYAEGLGYLGKGVIKYLALVKDLKNFKPSITAIGSTAVAAAYVAQTLPGNMGSLSTSLSAAVDFGRAQGVEIPADATAALK